MAKLKLLNNINGIVRSVHPAPPALTALERVRNMKRAARATYDTLLEILILYSIFERIGARSRRGQAKQPRAHDVCVVHRPAAGARDLAGRGITLERGLWLTE